MGEIADMVLDGLLDEETGEVIDGDAPGYPRRASDHHTKRPPKDAGRRARRNRKRAARRKARKGPPDAVQ